MPWDSGSGGSVTAAVAAHQPVPSPQFSAPAESAYPIVPPAGSSGQSPRQRRRTTSTGSSSDSLVRQSLEFDSQPQLQQQQQQQPRLSTRTMLFPQPTLGITGRQLLTGFAASTGDNFNEVIGEQQQSNGGKSSSGPITAHPSSSSSSTASGGPAHASPATSQQPDCPTIVKRTHSLKDDLIKRFRSKFAGNEPNSEHQLQQQQQQQLEHRQQQQQQQQQLNRSRPGSLRNTASPSAAPVTGGSGPGSVVVKVLPDKKLINKASSSENLSQGGAGNSSAADLNSLTSLVQRKRDRSQDSADSSNGSPPRRPAHIRKAPAPPPPSQAASQATAAVAGQLQAASQLPPGVPTSFPGDAIEEALAAMTACKAKPPSGRQRHLPSEDSSEPEDCRSRDSPIEEPTAHGSDSGVGSGAVLGHHRSNSFEFLQDAVQSRTAPKIRQPSAIRKISDSGQQPHQQRDASPCGKASPYGSSPPKTVSFNPTDEILTYEGAPSSRKSSHHRHMQQASRHQQTRQGDNAMIDTHSTMVEVMQNIVSNQRQFLTKVKEGSISIANYRDNTKNLLALQTRTIQKILDAIQADEKA